MRYFSLTIIGIVASISVFAQTSKGSFMIGGSVDYENKLYPNPPDDASGTDAGFLTPNVILSASPNVGYFILDNWVAGVSLSATVGRNRLFANAKGNMHGLGGGGFTRYYFRFGKFGAFPELSASWENTVTKNEFVLPIFNGPATLYYNSKTISSIYMGGAGFAWFVSSNIALEAIVSYSNKAARIAENKSSYNQLDFHVDLQFFIPAKRATN